MKQLIEIWKDIKGYEGLYKVSNYGRVKSLNYNKTKKEKELKLYKNKKGYFSVNLYLNKKIHSKLVHRLVAETFIPNPKNKPQVNHIDGDKTNDKVDNLEWVTNKENVIHSWKTGLSKKKYGKQTNCKKVNQYTLTGDFIKTWDSIKDASKDLKIDSSHISKCCKQRKYHKTTGGYIWRYTKN